MSETLPLAEIKAHLSEIVDRVEREHERIVLTRNGRSRAGGSVARPSSPRVDL